MALNKDVLGVALKSAADAFNEQNIVPTDAAALAEYRLNFWKAVAEAVINHFKTAGVVTTFGNSVTQTGTIA